MQFQDDLAGGVVLVRPALQSPNYLAGVSGWAVKIDGSAEFSNISIRGATTTGGRALYYNGTPAAGNLIISLSGAAGTDAFGNAYVKGLGAYGSSGQVVATDAVGNVATLAGNVGVGGLAAMPGLFLQPKFNVGGDPAMVGALDPGTHTDFSLLLTSPSPTVGGFPGTDFAQIAMIGPYPGPNTSLITLDAAGGVYVNSGTSFDIDGVIDSYGMDIFNTYTPVVGGAGSASYSVRTGWYMRIGKMIYVCAYVTVNNPGSGAGIVTITMPSAVDRTTRQVLTVHSESNGAGGNATSSIRGGEAVFFTSGSGAVVDRIRIDNGTSNESNLQGADLLSGGILTVQGWYREA